MPKGPLLTVSSVLGLVNYQGIYVTGYSLLFGMSVWVTFLGGPIAYKTLPRQQFGNLQHKTFPIYFAISTGISSALTAAWVWTHPDVAHYITSPSLADVAQVYALGSVALSMATNLFVVGPMTARTMFQRHKLERSEGKSYQDAGVSDQMKALNKSFGVLHGVSSLLNLCSVLALGFHGLWIGNAGVQGY